MPTKDVEKARKYRREHYYRNKDAYKARAKARKESIREFLTDLKAEEGCSRCEESDPRCLDWVQPGYQFNEGYAVTYGWGTDRIVEALEDFEVLCANCQRKQ